MAKLHVLSGLLEGKTFELIEERITVGRALDNMIRIEDGTVSHHHSMIVIDGDSFKVRDLNSTNGTRVNGLRIVETKLNNGDLVRMGSIEMRFESDIKKASQPLPPSHAGVDAAQIGAGAPTPPKFATGKTFGKKRKGSAGMLRWVVIGFGVMALVLVAWLIKQILVK